MSSVKIGKTLKPLSLNGIFKVNIINPTLNKDLNFSNSNDDL